ncbi:TetR/AcrR family transcriptional regulator [Candidatus Aerophobetes bacterium]|nr:TetR/AcrR family transcriptional regulator [Candidatus Aerophobetes bacterium]
MVRNKQVIEKRRIKRADQKGKILRAGEKLFAKKGFYLTTLEEIAGGANLAKGTIYLHFENKKDLFISIVERKLDILLKKIKEGIGEEGSPTEEIKKLTKVHLKFLERNRNFFKILQSLSKEYKREMEKELTERVIKKHTRYLGIIQHLIERAIKKKEMKPLDTRKLAVILIGIVHSLTINWISQGEKDSLSKDHELVWEIFWNGAKQA